jgi:hypothetical protein
VSSIFGEASRPVLVTLYVGRPGQKAHVAQLVEHVLGKDEVTGSIPVMGSMSCNYRDDLSEDITSKSIRRP